MKFDANCFEKFQCLGELSDSQSTSHTHDHKTNTKNKSFAFATLRKMLFKKLVRNRRLSFLEGKLVDVRDT